jgi:hypothetical protein
MSMRICSVPRAPDLAARLWTGEKRLLEVAERLGLAASARELLTQS